MLFAVAVVLAVVVVRLVGGVDWGAVRRALQHLSWWQAPILIVLLVVRQTLNSLPLSLYIPGVSPYQAVLNDQVAVLIGTVAPYPSDVAMRTAMFSSWGVAVPTGIAGALLHKFTFWIVRYAVPLAGLVILGVRGDDLDLRLLDLASIAFAVAIYLALALVMRSDALARTAGLRSGRVVARFRNVDPAGWASSCVRFRAQVGQLFHRRFPAAAAAMVGFLAVDAVMLTLCVRWVGISAHLVPMASVVAAFAIAYPLTLFPFSGIGVLDAAVIASVTAAGGHAVEAPAVAALLVWRVFALGGPILFGFLSVAIWHRTTGRHLSVRQILRGPRPTRATGGTGEG